MRQCDLIVGVTREIADHEAARARGPIPTLVYPNGCIVTDEDYVAAENDLRGQVPELLFVSSRFVSWRGLDRLLDDLPNCREDFVLHLVGQVGPEDHARAKDDPRIRFHGQLPAAEIRALAETAWLGLSSFALDRQNMAEACTLKVREYLKYGLPVYAGYREVFPAEVTFFRQGPARFEDILHFARQMRTIAQPSILRAAQPYIEKRNLLEAFSQELEHELLSNMEPPESSTRPSS
jgi:glycosyltransferase involved in cell wall biosynthesis